jgi:hypothetical protein
LQSEFARLGKRARVGVSYIVDVVAAVTIVDWELCGIRRW